MSLLEVTGLTTAYHTRRGRVQSVRGVDLRLERGEILGLVGESGSGKSVTCMSLLRLLKRGGRIEGGTAYFEGEDLLAMPEGKLARLRGDRVGVVFQDPMSALNPTMTVGRQITEVLLRHRRMTRAEARARAVELFGLVRIPSPAARIDSYPHEFSGGMRQRVMIAMALACEPALLIADEPTTALDVTIQRQILALLKELRDRLGMAIILVTHDLGVIAETADRVMVLYGGQVMEEAPVADLFAAPRHPYTRGLMAAIPDPRRAGEALAPIPGTPPDMRAPPPGCPFAPRCPEARRQCLDPSPVYEVSAAHRARCWLLDPSAPRVGWGEDPILRETTR
ncbi:ABC transporter ATP-binding protein [Pelagovum pacificum]|uniref:ABC transporter ATP-binding protein n=1 Tax=Pelagovum pacificum TaxID=2588711 RepID=A0A5C5GG50_9RHOB|nr:ABC transporter ATP-binding protein [Pelagovum pacificum]QQA43833.1 ABC transporter ATP-binding protein [Pelagovum pacificum]TNY33037.1 ABC transporter ATP-binding protein [Pelagovum pacificum]